MQRDANGVLHEARDASRLRSGDELADVVELILIERDRELDALNAEEELANIS